MKNGDFCRGVHKCAMFRHHIWAIFPAQAPISARSITHITAYLCPLSKKEA